MRVVTQFCKRRYPFGFLGTHGLDAYRRNSGLHGDDPGLPACPIRRLVPRPAGGGRPLPDRASPGGRGCLAPSRSARLSFDIAPVRRQRLWEQIVDMNNRGFRTHRNPQVNEDDPGILRPHVGTTRQHRSTGDRLRIFLSARRRGKRCKHGIVGARDVRFHGSLSYATSPPGNFLSAPGGLGNYRILARARKFA